jgi:hypothetical protein
VSRRTPVAVFAVLLGPAIAQADPGTSADWIGRAQQEITRREYHASASDQGLQAPNRAHNLRTWFEPTGIRVHDRTAEGSPRLVELRLASVGRGDALAPVPPGEVSHREGRVEIRRPGLVEWYENSERGLEQGFTLTLRPAGSGTLGVQLEITGAEGVLSGDAVLLDSAAGRRLRFGSLRVIDAAGRSLPASFEMPAPRRIRIAVADEGASYPLTIDPILTETADALLQSNLAGAQLGAVSGAGDVNGDGFADVIVGAPNYDAGQPGEGAAFVFLGSASGIASGSPATAHAQLEADRNYALMGSSVASAGDVNGDGYADVIVGAPRYDENGSAEGAGAAFVFLGSASGVASGTSDTAHARLEGGQDPEQAYSYLGASVASAGDANGDGYADVIVGAPYYTHELMASAGSAFVFEGSATGIQSGGPENANAWIMSDQNASVGTTVASAGDVNGDGYADVIVGAPFYSGPEEYEGAVFLFLGSAGGIATGASASADARIEANKNWAYMGESVASAGDVNGDGYGDVIVGNRYYIIDPQRRGAAFVFHGSASGIANGSPDTAQARLESDQAAVFLGWSAAGAGDVNGDGYADVIVGAPFYSGPEVTEGGAFVFLGSTSGIGDGTPDTAYARLESNQQDARMGGGVASAGDVNGDGYADVIAAAHQYDAGEGNEGAAFVYMGGATGIASGTTAAAASHLHPDLYVSVAAGAGDVNGDDYSDVIVGAPDYDAGEGPGQGAAFVFHGSDAGIATGGTPTADARLVSDQAASRFGAAVASAGDVDADGYGDIIIGAPDYDAGEPDEGAAFVMLGSSTGIDDAEPLLALAVDRIESDEPGAHLGASVASAGDVNGDGYGDVIVSAPAYDTAADQGAAFLFHGSAVGISASDAGDAATQLSAFGANVAGAGDVNGDGYADVIAGDPDATSGFAGAGAAAIHPGGPSGIDPLDPLLSITPEQADMALGASVAGAGDVNRDGYADVIVGAPDYDAAQTDEGAAFVFLGRSDFGAGTSTTAGADGRIESAIAQGRLGTNVAGAGDTNGDGYADVIVDEPSSSRALLYSGSAAGIANETPATAAAEIGVELLGEGFSSLSGAGDVNGDGFADVILGRASYAEAFVFEGGGDGRPVRARQLRRPSRRVQAGGSSREDVFEVRLTATHPEGRGRARLEVEACPTGVAFGAPACVQQISPGWTEVPATAAGVDLGVTVSGLAEDTLYRWRARVLHAPVSVTQAGITPPANPAHGPWRTLSGQASEADIRVGSQDYDDDSLPNDTDPDDDGDDLLDAVETGTGVYASTADTGTDPLRVDSDGDGFWDGWEVSIQTDPDDPADPGWSPEVGNSAIQATDQPKYRWRSQTSFASEFVAPEDVESGVGVCSMTVPSKFICDLLGEGSGCILVDFGFDPPPQPAASGLACCPWVGTCELTCADNTCSNGEVCPLTGGECAGNDLCVNGSLNCAANQQACNDEYSRLLGLGVPACCFESAGSSGFEWDASGPHVPGDVDEDRFEDICDNCPDESNPDQADGDGDRRGSVCDTHVANPLRCADTDLDECDDCSSGAFDPAYDGDPILPGVTCIPVPEPGVVPGLLAGIALLGGLGARRARRHPSGCRAEAPSLELESL